MSRIYRMLSYSVLATSIFLLTHIYSVLINLGRVVVPVHSDLGHPTSDHELETTTNDNSIPYVWNVGMPVMLVVDEQSPKAVFENSFRSRLKRFNEALGRVRHHAVTQTTRRVNGSWPKTRNDRVLIRGDDDRFMDSLDAFDGVTTVLLPWAVSRRKWIVPTRKSLTTGTSNGAAVAVPVWNGANDTWNLPIRDYYTWTGDEDLCRFVDTPGVHSNVPRDRNCSTNIEDAFHAVVLNPIYLDWKAASTPGTKHGGGEIVRTSSTDRLYHVTASSQLYVHLIESALVTSIGDVTSEQFKFVPFGCVPEFSLAVPKKEELAAIPAVDEMFVASQYWGAAVFHRAVEVVPRLAPFLDFLQLNPTIVIHVPETGGRMAELVELFGISRRRLIDGPVRARLVYLPPITHCGQAAVRQIQLTAEIYRKSLGRERRMANRVILIQRTGKRRFLRPATIERVVRAAVRNFGLELTLFGDNPSPSLNETMAMFQSAVMDQYFNFFNMARPARTIGQTACKTEECLFLSCIGKVNGEVVGPHGAGETNLIFSHPGVFVVEVVCTNMCLKHMSHVMGHRWHGLQARNLCRRGVIDIDPAKIDRAVRRHLAMWQRLDANGHPAVRSR